MSKFFFGEKYGIFREIITTLNVFFTDYAKIHGIHGVEEKKEDEDAGEETPSVS